VADHVFVGDSDNLIGIMNTLTPIGLSVRETAWLMSASEPQIRYMLRVGCLSYAVKPRLVSIESVRALIAKDPFAEVREVVLARVLRGEAQPPRLASRYGRHSVRSLIIDATGANLPDGMTVDTTFTIRRVSVHNDLNLNENK
jgi:hypothetical protein